MTRASRARDALCTACGREHGLGRIYRCEACGAPLDVRYDYARIPRAAFDPPARDRGRGLWIFADLLPVAPDAAITLGEGQTPLLACRKLGERLGLDRLWVKDETRQPTGSFKDRPLSVAVSRARELGFDTVVTASSGNAAAAMAAYAAQGGLRAVVIVPADAPPPKLFQMLASGARVVRVRGSVSDCIQLAQAAARGCGWCNVTSTFENPYSVEGDKTVAYELARDLGWRAPDWIAVPTGSGPLPVGIYKGFAEMQRAGLIERLPRMVAAQAEGCAPIARAFRSGAAEVTPWADARTIAGGIQDPLVGYSQDGTRTLGVVRQSGGAAVALPDAAIEEATRWMARDEGVYVEPTAAVATAAVAALRGTGTIRDGETVVVIATGHGLKQPVVRAQEADALPTIDPHLEAFRALGL
ncbi:MAG: threonine synthase [Candidatus Methylomirabilales bacterium]